MNARTKYSIAILAVVTLGAARIVTLSAAQSVQPSAETVELAARLDAAGPSVLLLNTVTLGNDDVPVSEYLEPILIHGYIWPRLTVLKRQDSIFRSGVDQ